MHTLPIRLLEIAWPFSLILALILSALPLSLRAAGPTPTLSTDTHNRFVINLQSSTTPPKVSAWPAELSKFQSYRLYVTSRSKNDKTWYRLRLGFFSDYQDASQALQTLKKHFPSAWLGRATQEEIKQSASSSIAPSFKAASGKAAPLPRTANKSEARADTDIEAIYAVNLLSELKPFDLGKIPRHELFSQYQVYETTFEIKGRTWYRLRLGFFPTQAEAVRAQRKLKELYPKAWVTKTPLQERLAAMEATLPPVATSAKDTAQTTTAKPTQAPIAKLRPLSPEQFQALMDDAQKAMTEQNYSRAVQLYSKLLRYPDHPHRQEAQELVGVAREKNGQLAHAAFEYKRYLEQYPEGEDAERVKQRLAGVMTARAEPQQKLREARGTRTRGGRRHSPWQFHGGWSQFYRRDQNKFNEDEGTVVSRSALDSDLNLTARYRGPSFDVRTRVTGGYTYDLLDEGEDSFSRLSSLYVDTTHLRSGLSARIGRQSRNTGGIFGRFDGGLFGYQATKWGKLNLVAGYPVNSSSDSFKDDRLLYGASLELGTFANAWEMETYYLKQTIDGYTDREAVGGELRYFSPSTSIVSLLDYDIHYEDLNLASVLGNWRFRNQWTLNASYSFRKSPLLSTRNALISQPIQSIEELIELAGEETINELATDRTADSHSATLGGSKALNRKLQLTTTLTASQNLGTPASDPGITGIEPVAEIPDGDVNYFFNFQFIGSGLIKSGDLSTVGLQYADTGTASTYSVLLNTRYPITRAWRINPKLRVSYRDRVNDDSHEWSTSPALRIDYRALRRLRFETEVGGTWRNARINDETQKSTSYYAFFGYRFDW